MAKPAPRLSESDIFNIVIGTAGHIDHGKSALVQRITGVDPDRLKEEQERGMTIDLGFAPLALADGRRVGIIDVPGHERFVKNMVAGATGIDAVILVVAADDGVMPQTREHSDIMGLLGVRRGLVVITKIDLVDEEMRELVRDDVERYLRDTFLRDARIVCASSVTGEGLEDVKKAIEGMLKEVSPRSTDGIFRMPIQRVFSAKGHGTIVTGIPVSGKVQVGDPVEIQPGGERGRVRAVQAYHRPAESARAGHSSALNLSDVDYRKVKRGQVALTPDTIRPAKFVDVRLHCLHSLKRSLKHLSEVRFHSGTSEELGKVAILEKGSLGPGETSLVQIRLETPVVVAPGDRFVLRLHSPMVTLGGGKVIGTSRWRLKSRKEYVLERLDEKERSIGRGDEMIASLVKEAGAEGVARVELQRAALMEPAEFARQVETLKGAGEIVELTKPVRYLHRETLATLQDRVVKVLEEFHRKEPLRLRMEKSALERGAGADRSSLELALEGLIRDGRVVAEGRGSLRLSGHEVRTTARQGSIASSLDEIFRESRFTTPRRDEVAGRVGEPEEEVLPVLRYLMEKEDLVEIGDGVILHRQSVEEAARLARETIVKEGELTVIRFKDILGSTRKYVVPLLEHLDAIGVTVRDGNRRLAAGGAAGGGGESERGESGGAS